MLLRPPVQHCPHAHGAPPRARRRRMPVRPRRRPTTARPRSASSNSGASVASTASGVAARSQKAARSLCAAVPVAVVAWARWCSCGRARTAAAPLCAASLSPAFAMCRASTSASSSRNQSADTRTLSGCSTSSTHSGSASAPPRDPTTRPCFAPGAPSVGALSAGHPSPASSKHAALSSFVVSASRA